MTQWSAEALAALSETRRRFIRLRLAQGCKATTETRIALVAFERGLSDQQLEQFYFVNRKGAEKRHFDTEAFAKKYGVDIRWLWDGELCGHPRGRRASKPGRATAEALSPREGMQHDHVTTTPGASGHTFGARVPSNPGQ